MKNSKQNSKMIALVVASVLGGMVIGQAVPAQAQLGGLIKGGAIGVIVTVLAKPIDSFINTVTGNKTGGDQATKVVPIVTLGGGTYAGAVQVSGLRDDVDRVQAVVQLEARKGFGRLVGEIRVRGLVPISTKNASGNSGSLNRVKGVGVSALIDSKL